MASTNVEGNVDNALTSPSDVDEEYRDYLDLLYAKSSDDSSSSTDSDHEMEDSTRKSVNENEQIGESVDTAIQQTSSRSKQKRPQKVGKTFSLETRADRENHLWARLWASRHNLSAKKIALGKPSASESDQANERITQPVKVVIRDKREEEVLRLSEEQTACQYCGISYLLLTKYEKMQSHVLGLESELNQLKQYELERPDILRKIELYAREIKTLQLSHDQQKQQLEEALTDQEDLQQSLNAAEKKSEPNISLTTVCADTVSMIRTDVTQELAKRVENAQATQVAQLHEARADANRVREELQDREAGASHREQELNLMIQENQEHIRTLKDRLKQLQYQHIELERQLKDRDEALRRALHHYDSYKQTSTIEHKEFERSVNKLRQENSSAHSKIIELEQLLGDERNRVNEFQTQIDSNGFNTSRMLAQKDLEINRHAQTLRDLQSQLNALRVERQKTIEAHQSRVKQLQDKYLDDIAEAGRIEAERAREETTTRLVKEKEEALKKLRQEMEAVNDSVRSQLMSLVAALRQDKERMETELKSLLQKAEDNWRTKISALEKRYTESQKETAVEKSEMAAHILALQSEMKTMCGSQSSKFDGESAGTVRDLRTQLTRKDAEIAFLKETVRLECEERMTLVAEADKMKQKLESIQQQKVGIGQIAESGRTPSLEPPSNIPISSSSKPLNKTQGDPSSSDSGRMQPKNSHQMIVPSYLQLPSDLASGSPSNGRTDARSDARLRASLPDVRSMLPSDSRRAINQRSRPSSTRTGRPRSNQAMSKRITPVSSSLPRPPLANHIPISTEGLGQHSSLSEFKAMGVSPERLFEMMAKAAAFKKGQKLVRQSNIL
ncbi:hypothetical protein BJ742DRAFT_895078 [Cladochytrium replicatum]|nr:hypothetical protein BJ742DRAFT_895078 [Cladochytrium replicatum]